MRLKITINMTNKWIPFEYHGYLQGVIYHALEDYQARFFHDEGFSYQDRLFKMFVFSELSGRYRVENRGLVFEEPAHFYISSISSDFMNSLYLSFTNTPYISLGKLTTEILEVSPVDDVIYNDDNEYVLKTLSPIVCFKTDQKKYVTYFHPKSQDFEDGLRNNISRKYLSLFENNDEEFFEIKNIITCKETKVRFKKSIYPAYLVTMKVKVSDGYLKLLMHAGLGSKNAAGFGMIEIIK